MSQQLALYIDTTSDSLLASLTSSQRIASNTLPLFYGDTVSLKIYLLDKSASATFAQPSLAPVPLTGLALQLYIDNGVAQSPTIYTQQVTFAIDATNVNAQFFYANLALNTDPIKTLITNAGGLQATAYIKIGYVQSGFTTTVLSQQVLLATGVPAGATTVPAGQTTLTVEVANNTFVPLTPVNGAPVYIASALGKIIALYAKDQADGSVTFQAEPVN